MADRRYEMGIVRPPDAAERHIMGIVNWQRPSSWSSQKVVCAFRRLYLQSSNLTASTPSVHSPPSPTDRVFILTGAGVSADGVGRALAELPR
jgi:hypothetical protein